MKAYEKNKAEIYLLSVVHDLEYYTEHPEEFDIEQHLRMMRDCAREALKIIEKVEATA